MKTPYTVELVGKNDGQSRLARVMASGPEHAKALAGLAHPDCVVGRAEAQTEAEAGTGGGTGGGAGGWTGADAARWGATLLCVPTGAAAGAAGVAASLVMPGAAGATDAARWGATVVMGMAATLALVTVVLGAGAMVAEAASGRRCARPQDRASVGFMLALRGLALVVGLTAGVGLARSGWPAGV
jgi:hypothetical protein